MRGDAVQPAAFCGFALASTPRMAWPLALSFALGTATAAHAGIVAIGPGGFSGSQSVVTFSEVALGTTIPFTVGLAQFGGLAGETMDAGPFGAPPAPSGVPYLQSGSVGNDDVIEVVFGAAQASVGVYFDTASSIFKGGTMQMEFYSGETLLGILDAMPDEGSFGGGVGGTAGSAIIDRVVFRETDADLPISFRLDDLTFEVPAPSVLACLGVALARGRGRRRECPAR